MGAEKRLLPIKEAFQLAQQPHQNQAKLVVALSRTYGSVSAAPGPPCPSPALSLPGASRDPPDSNLLNFSDPVRIGLAFCLRSPSRLPSGFPRGPLIVGWG